MPADPSLSAENAAVPTAGPWRYHPPMTVMGPIAPVASDVAPRNGPLVAAAPALCAIVRRLVAGWTVRPAWGDKPRAWSPPGSDDRDWHLIRCDVMTDEEEDALDMALIFTAVTGASVKHDEEAT
jgi:hypothetical protein